MRGGETLRVFDRTNWRRKVRAPAWLRSETTETTQWPHPTAKPTKEW